MSTAPQARMPVAAPAATLPGVIIALAVGAVGAGAAHDGLVTTGAVSGPVWAQTVADTVSGATPQTWMLPAGVAAALVGLWFVVAAVKPRRRTGLPLGTGSAVWIAPRDVARLAASTAASVPGVTRSTATASQRSVTVSVAGADADLEALRAQIESAVATRLEPLQEAPALRVRATTQRAPR